MLGRAIAASAARLPAKTAVIHNDEAVSYGAFVRAIERAASLFAGRGLGGEGVVVLAVSHLLDAWILSLGLRELGLTVLPAASGADVAALPLTGVRAVVTHADEDWEGLDEACAARGWPLLRAGRADLAGAASPWRPAPTPGGHILRTSGTTGAYKNVLMAPDFELGFLAHRNAVFGTGEHTVVAQFHFTLWTGVGYKTAGEVWMAGGTVVLNQVRPSVACLNRPDITHIHLTPPILAELLAEPALPYFAEGKASVAAGAITEAQAAAARARLAPRLYSSMGSTEAAIFAFTRLETPEDRRWHKPAPGASFQVVNDSGQPVAVGEIGRVRVSTAGGPNAYIEDPETTAQFFQDGWFYPGDLAEIRADGRLALHGRITDVISHQGVKIAPAPIEDVLRERLGVSGVCLFSRQNDAGEELIHVVVEAPAPLAMDAVIPILREELRGFPGARLHYLSALPRNELGKIVRAKVQALVVSR